MSSKTLNMEKNPCCKSKEFWGDLFRRRKELNARFVNVNRLLTIHLVEVIN